jgi:hypothetical protein
MAQFKAIARPNVANVDAQLWEQLDLHSQVGVSSVVCGAIAAYDFCGEQESAVLYLCDQSD